jgi:MoaA/NifB/PqqE/SkfB family radical SAM enzyme
MVNLTGLGESLLNPNIISMVKYAKNSGLRVQIVTNLTEVDENTLEGLIKAKLDVLAVSFDGATKETFEKIRVGAVFEEVVENIKLLLRLKREMEVGKPKVYLNSTVCEENVREIPAMIKMAEDLGVNGIVFMKQAVPGTKYWDSNVFSLLANEKFHSEKIEVIGCLDMKSMCCVARTCYITFDGKVLPCYPIYELISRDEYKHYEMEDLTRQRFSEIWFSRRYRQLRTSKVFGMPLPFCYSCFANK